MNLIILLSFVLLLSIGYSVRAAHYWLQPPIKEAECPRACPRVLNPVCAFDGIQRFRFFYNDCALRQNRCESQNAWSATHLSLCLHMLDSEQLARCLRPCRFEFQPVCATNGKRTEIFGNECIYNVDNCFANERWSKLPEELCVF